MEQQKIGKPKKKLGVARYFITLAGYLVALVAVLYFMGAASTWLNGRIEKVQEDAAGAATEAGKDEAVEAANLLDGRELVYSQADLDKAVQAEAAEAERAADARVEQAVIAKEEEILGGIRANIMDGDTLLEALRPYYPNELVVASNGRYHFVPINDSLKKNAWVQENLEILESGEYRYLQDEEVISHKGIDVSAYQGSIDWSKAAADGVEFAFIRGAYRGYGTGKLVADQWAERNLKNAAAAGVKVGVYVYTQAVTEEEAKEEANLLLRQAAPYGTGVPIIIDVEKVTAGDGRMNSLTAEERTNMVLAFCKTVEEAGFRPMLYYNTEAGALMLDLAALENYPKWFASYSETFYYPYEYGIWQYSEKGVVDGVKGNVDLNISFSKFWED